MRKTAVLAAFLAASALALPARAETVEDEQTWINVTAFGTVAGKLVYFAEVQPRIYDGSSRVGMVALRGALGYKVSPKVTLYGGYAHFVLPIEGGRDRNEERLFQQVQWTIDRHWSSRTRLEQRRLSNGDDTGWRLREMIRWETPLGRDKDGLAALGYAELFVAFNDTDWGARGGFDQIRGFAGLEIPLKGPSTIEAGYLNQTINAAGGVTRMNHVAALALMLRF